MAVCYYLICVQCKKKVWIGQWNYIYTGEKETMILLQKFPYEHEGHSLVFLPEHEYDEPGQYVEVKDELDRSS